MKKTHYAEIVYAGFDPEFEDRVILGAEKNNLMLLSITLTSKIPQTVLLLRGDCSKRVFQNRLSKLESETRKYKRGGKPKEFTVWVH